MIARGLDMSSSSKQASNPKRWLVSGASSGIGLAVCANLLEADAEVQVVAASRSATRSADLQDLDARHPGRLRRIDVDLSDPEAITVLGDQLAGRGQVLDRVFHAAGLLHDQNTAPEKSLQQVSAASLQRSFAINGMAPILLLQALLPVLRGAPAPVFASLSARVGSISDNRLGGWYAYRASKAAQNQLLKTAAIELRRSLPALRVVMLHPGTVDTPLSAPFQRGVPEHKLFAAPRAAQQLLQVIDKLGLDDSGRFIAWDGSDIPW